jgi:hypothetical protein
VGPWSVTCLGRVSVPPSQPARTPRSQCTTTPGDYAPRATAAQIAPSTGATCAPPCGDRDPATKGLAATWRSRAPRCRSARWRNDALPARERRPHRYRRRWADVDHPSGDHRLALDVPRSRRPDTDPGGDLPCPRGREGRGSALAAVCRAWASDDGPDGWTQVAGVRRRVAWPLGVEAPPGVVMGRLPAGRLGLADHVHVTSLGEMTSRAEGFGLDVPTWPQRLTVRQRKMTLLAHQDRPPDSRTASMKVTRGRTGEQQPCP